MQIEFLQPARTELDDAVRYNGKECAGLGDEFLTENLKRVATRRRISACAASLFATDAPLPYAIIYRASESRILIIAVAHMHREPGYWKNRSKP